MLRTKGTKGSVGFARSADSSLARETLGIEPVIRSQSDTTTRNIT